MMNFCVLLLVLVISVFFGALDAAEKKEVGHVLSEWKFGKTLFGDEVMPASLRGKVVVVEYWGAKCSSCKDGMAQLVSLDEKYRGKGLRVIGAEAYRSGKEQISAVVASQKVGFSITDGVSGPISIVGLPHVVVFGVEGKLLFSGHPNEERFEKIVKGAMAKMKEVSGAAEERSWTSHEGKSLVATLKRVEEEKVIFRLKDGREVPYEIKKLSEEDQEFIRAGAAK